MADYHQAIADIRARIDAELGLYVPLAVTATSYHLANDPCAFAKLTTAERAAYVLDVYACGANAGASHVMWFKTIDREVPEGKCPLDANGMFSPSRTSAPWKINKNLESLSQVGHHLNPLLP